MYLTEATIMRYYLQRTTCRKIHQNLSPQKLE